jgi:hypothetical protein
MSPLQSLLDVKDDGFFLFVKSLVVLWKRDDDDVVDSVIDSMRS